MASDSAQPSLESTNSDQMAVDVTKQSAANTPDSEELSPKLPVTESSSGQDLHLQVGLKHEGEYLALILPPTQSSETDDWSEVWEQLHYRLQGSDRTWKTGMPVHLMVKDRLLDGRQLQDIDDALNEVQLKLQLVATSRRQTAVAAAGAGYSVQQQSLSSFASQYAPEPEAIPSIIEPLYWQSTVRSGMEIRHPGTVIVMGDLNPGGAVVAAGDIFIWGRLRGVAYAGSDGNRKSRIMALQMEPTQLRIADLVARAPETPPDQLKPEVAYVSPDGIRLTSATNFVKSYSFSEEVGGWV